MQSSATVKVSVDNLTKGRTVNATTFDTDVAAAGVTLTGTTLSADGTDADIDINITPKGSGEVNITKVDIDGGAIDGTTIGASSASTGVFTRVDSDNVRVDGNDVYATNTDGALNLYANGTGTINATSVTRIVGNGDALRMSYAVDGGACLIGWYNTSGVGLWSIGGGTTIRQDELAFKRGGTTVLYLQNDNAVKFPNIGTTGSAANAFLDSGDSNNLLRSTSSLRYKTDIEPLAPEYSARVFELEPIWYRSLAPRDNKDWSWYGLGAEQVAEIDPRLVHWGYLPSDYETVKESEQDANGNVYVRERVQLKADAKLVPDGVQYERLSVLLLAEMKKMKAEIESLKAEVAKLK